LIFCSSQKPNSRSRSIMSGEAASCLMHTTAPARTRLSGQTRGPAQWPSKITHEGFGFFTEANHSPSRTPWQGGIPGLDAPCSIEELPPPANPFERQRRRPLKIAP
jgi:hypothetical protein